MIIVIILYLEVKLPTSMRFRRFQSGDTSEQFLIPSVQGKESSLFWYTFHLSSDRFPMVQHNVPNRSSVSQTQTQTAIVCLQMICLSRSILFFSFSSRSPLSPFLIFSCVYVSLAASFSLICVHSICHFLSLSLFLSPGWSYG